LAARAYLRYIFVGGIEEAAISSCSSFVAGMLPYLKSDEVMPTSCRPIWETLLRILNKFLRGEPELHVRTLFIALLGELEVVVSRLGSARLGSA
jgi:hypothetical protein